MVWAGGNPEDAATQQSEAGMGWGRYAGVKGWLGELEGREGPGDTSEKKLGECAHQLGTEEGR